MNEDVARAAAAWFPAWGVPAPPAAGGKDLRGQSIRVAKFDDDATVRFFFPRRTLSFQRRITTVITRGLTKRGAKIASVHPTVEDYARWQAAQELPDSVELRFRFASQPPEL